MTRPINIGFSVAELDNTVEGLAAGITRAIQRFKETQGGAEPTHVGLPHNKPEGTVEAVLQMGLFFDTQPQPAGTVWVGIKSPAPKPTPLPEVPAEAPQLEAADDDEFVEDEYVEDGEFVEATILEGDVDMEVDKPDANLPGVTFGPGFRASSHIADIEWNEEDGIVVLFSDESRYRYPGLTDQDYEHFLIAAYDSGSFGETFNNLVKQPGYAYERWDDAKEEWVDPKHEAVAAKPKTPKPNLPKDVKKPEPAPPGPPAEPAAVSVGRPSSKLAPPEAGKALTESRGAIIPLGITIELGPDADDDPEAYYEAIEQAVTMLEDEGKEATHVALPVNAPEQVRDWVKSNGIPTMQWYPKKGNVWVGHP
jgi:hypothetical protein